MKFLIVEDNPTDAELLRLLLEARFPRGTSYFDATSLDEAIRLLERLDFDVIILDLNLPDSVGDSTFTKLHTRFPHIPIIVLTHNKDRQLAVRMVREGAADYLLKDFHADDDNVEQIFARISFAIERHRRSVRIPEEEAAVIRKVERASANMLSAHQSGQQRAVRDTTVETTAALADLTRKMVIEVQKLSNEMAKANVQSARVVETVDLLEKELIRGHSNRPSMRSQVDLMEHRLTTVEGRVGRLGDKVEEAETTQQQQALKLHETRMTNRTKILIGILGFLGVVATAIATYKATVAKIGAEPPAKESPK